MPGFLVLQQIDDVPPEMAAIPHSFKICSEEKSLYVFADSDEDRISWRRMIREAVRALRPSHAPRRGTGGIGGDGDLQVYGFDAGLGVRTLSLPCSCCNFP